MFVIFRNFPDFQKKNNYGFWNSILDIYGDPFVAAGIVGKKKAASPVPIKSPSATISPKVQSVPNVFCSKNFRKKIMFFLRFWDLFCKNARKFL